MSLTALLVPRTAQMLRAMSSWLGKAEAQLGEPAADAMLAARLAPDMFPLSSQIRFACVQAREAVHRLKGEPMPESLHTLIAEGGAAGEHPGTIAGAKARIAETTAFLDSLAPDALDSGAKRDIAIVLQDGMTFDMSGEDFARDWAIPQFHFHLVTAYAILRHRGVALGKVDYVAHMAAYLRPGTPPAG